MCKDLFRSNMQSFTKYLDSLTVSFIDATLGIYFLLLFNLSFMN